MREQIDRKSTLMRCLSFIIPAVFFSIVTDSVYMAIIALTACILLLVRQKSVELTLRSAIYAATIALTVTILTNTIFKIENRFFMSPAELAVPGALIFAMALSFFDYRPTFTAGVLIMSIFAMMMCGDINQAHTFRNLPLSGYLGTMEGIQNMYIVCMVLCIVPFYFLMNRSHFNLKAIAKGNMKSIALRTGLIVSAFLMVTSIYRPTLDVVVPISKEAERSLTKFLSQFRSSNQKKKKAFDKNVNLRDSFFSKDQNLDQVLIRVLAPNEPGYIRSRVYENYFNGSWTSYLESSTMALLNEDHDYTHSSFSFKKRDKPPKKEDLEKIEISYSGNFEVSTILHMGKTVFIEMTCENLEQTSSGTVSGKGVDYSGAITLYNEKEWTMEDSFPDPEMTEAEFESYLQIHEEEDYELKKNLLERFDLIVSDRSSPNVIATSIVNYFHKAFEYKLGTRIQGVSDPILTFLDNGKGHCELFASPSGS